MPPSSATTATPPPAAEVAKHEAHQGRQGCRTGRRHLMRNTTLTTRKVLAIGFAVTVLTAGAAYAYWSSEGSGTGVAPTAAGTTALTLNQANDVDPMFPGDSTQALSGTFGNTNDGPIYVNTVTVSI